MAGKGDKQRPREVDKKVFEDNWDRIFKKKKKENLLPFCDSQPTTDMFDNLNLKQDRTGDNNE
jgi:hypothetical protein